VPKVQPLQGQTLGDEEDRVDEVILNSSDMNGVLDSDNFQLTRHEEQIEALFRLVRSLPTMSDFDCAGPWPGR
jgi:hypothetical protein